MMAYYNTNPKKIIQLENNSINLSIKRNKEGVPETFSFNGLSDTSTIKDFNKIDVNSQMFLEMYSDKELQRVDLGTISKPKIIMNETININRDNKSLKMNFFIKKNYIKVASKESLKPQDDSLNSTEGILIVDPCDLGETMWRVSPLDGLTEPILKVNNNQQIGLTSFLNSVDGRALILINAIEQIIRILPGKNNVEWVDKWITFLKNEGIDDIPDDENDPLLESWVEDTVDKIAKKWKLVSSYEANLFGEKEDDD